MDLGIKGKKALVTGGSSGLGMGAAKALAAEGVRVIIASRSKENLERAVESLGPNASYIVADLSQASNASRLIDATVDRLGGLDILICNSGGPKPGGFFDKGLEDYRSAIESNMLSSIALSQAAVQYMIDAGWGRIVAITSLWVRQPSANLILSNTARSGLTAFIKTMALTVADKQITANTIQPGLHQTSRLIELNGDNLLTLANQVPAKSLGSPDDFGAVITFLCSQQAKYITGASINVDGGLYSGLM